MKNLNTRLALVLAVIACALSLWNVWRLPSRQEMQTAAEAETLRMALQQALDENDHEKVFSLISFEGFEEQTAKIRKGWEPILALDHPRVEVRLFGRHEDISYAVNDKIIWNGKPSGRLVGGR